MATFESPAHDTPQNWGNLEAHLSDAGLNFDSSYRPKQFASGFGNKNYLIRVDGKLVVLRRPPPGPIPPGANDMKRESRILSHLPKGFPLAPRTLHYCENPDVLGAQFFIMEYRPGLVIGGMIPDSVLDNWTGPAPIGKHLGHHMIETLAALHQVAPKDVGLETLGHPDGFNARSIVGWVDRANLAWQDNPPSVLTEIAAWLHSHKPADKTPTIIHNDFKLDNIILDPDTLEPVAVIDWDMGTRGAPLYDLAVCLSYWTEADNPKVMHMLKQMPTAKHGFPTREQAAAHYKRKTKTDFDDFHFYRVLSTLRIAVVFKQLHRRYETGGTTDKRFTDFGYLADGLLLFCNDIVEGKYF